MAFNDFTSESAENYEQKCLCVLVLDVSSSMEGSKIDELNKGLAEFYRDIFDDSVTSKKLEIAIVEFSSSAAVVQQPSLVENFTMPTLTTKGSTALVDGVNAGIEIVRDRKDWYKSTGQPYYRPWVILMTDGYPDSNQDTHQLKIDISSATGAKEYFFFGVGVSGADMSMLTEISSDGVPPAALSGLRFSEFFQWLSASMSTIGASADGENVELPNPAAWMDGFKV